MDRRGILGGPPGFPTGKTGFETGLAKPTGYEPKFTIGVETGPKSTGLNRFRFQNEVGSGRALNPV